MNKLNNTIEVLKSHIDDIYPSEDPSNNEIRQNIINFLNLASDSYGLIEWPESQLIMEESWFKEEAILALGSEDKTGSSAYFVPVNRLLNN